MAICGNASPVNSVVLKSNRQVAAFDKIIAINAYMFWKDPEAVLLGLRNRMKPDGVIALIFQSRKRDATDEDTQRGAEDIAAALQRAGFKSVRIETFEMKPVNAACVFAKAPACCANEPS